VIAALSDRLQLVAVCDLNEAVGRQIGEQYGVSHFTSFEKMLESGVEAVSILTYAYNHHLLGAAAARAGKHVLVEKPIALTLPCADYLIGACGDAGVLLQVAENYPFMPHDALINRLAHSGAIGGVVAVFVCDDINGMTLDIGVHRFAQVRGAVAARPIRLSAEVRLPNFGRAQGEVTDRCFGDPFGEYWGRATVEFENGALGFCECFPLLRAAPVWANDYRRIIGTEGVITDDLWPNIFPPLAKGEVRVHRWEGRAWEERPIEHIRSEGALERLVLHGDPSVVWENPFRECRFPQARVEWASPASLEMWLIAEAELYSGFAHAIREGTAPPYPGELGRLDLEMCLATYESARRGAPLALPLVEITEHERRVHLEFRERYGREPLPPH